MDTLDKYRQIIQNVLEQYTRVPYAYGDIEIKVFADREGDHYLLMTVGWENARRVHGCLVHIDIIDGKLWIQRDGTEYGVAEELVEAGIPRSHIVLGFQPPAIRQYTQYAAA